jgi:dihydropyrimidinase
MWLNLANGTFTVVSSDHAPSTFDHPCGKKKAIAKRMAESGESATHACAHADFRDVPNGLPGIETRLPLIFDRTFDPNIGDQQRGNNKIRISLPRFVELTSTNPAKLYGLSHRKGSLLPGYDADIVIWYPEEPSAVAVAADGGENPGAPRKFKITNDSLHHSIDYTPFEGVEVRNWPRRVLLRGKLVWNRDDGGLVGGKSDGQYLRRGKSTILTGQMGRIATGMMDGERDYWM